MFPFFKWLVVEVDFARFKAVSMTTAVDYGGVIGDLLAPVWPSNGNKSLQPQPMDEFNEGSTTDYRTETGPVLTQAMHLLLNQTNLIDWGKQPYKLNENGGISGIVFYDTTRAEDNPEDAVGEPWQPGIPKVQVNLYSGLRKSTFRRWTISRVRVTSTTPTATAFFGPHHRRRGISTVGGSTCTLADVDNYPFGSSAATADPGSGRRRPVTGTAISTSAMPSRSPLDRQLERQQTQQLRPDSAGNPRPADSRVRRRLRHLEPGPSRGLRRRLRLRTPHRLSRRRMSELRRLIRTVRMRSNVGYLKTGNYIVEAVPPPHIKITQSQDKNVDFGEIFIPSPLALPPQVRGRRLHSCRPN